jgi:ankyrin repeat protein
LQGTYVDNVLEDEWQGWLNWGQTNTETKRHQVHIQSSGRRPEFVEEMSSRVQTEMPVQMGQCDRIKELLANGDASPADIVAPYGLTTLSLAVTYGRLDVCNLLTATGAHQYSHVAPSRISDVIDFWSGYNLLHCSLHASAVLMDMLCLCSTDHHRGALRRSLSGSFPDSEPFSRLHESILGISAELPEEVIRQSRPDVNNMDILSRTALHWAACEGNSNLIECVLRYGADPDVRDRDGKAPLHIVAALGFAEAAASLLAAGAKLEIQDCFGNTPIQPAAMRGHTSIIELLLDAKADIDSENGVGETPLISAALANEAQAVDLLYRRGADIEHQCHWKYTPIGKALLVNGFDAIRNLLERGARTDFVPPDGKTVLHLAAESADAKTLGLLVSFNIGNIDVSARDNKG